MRRITTVAALTLAVLATTAATASAAIYKVDVRGSQKVTWSFDADLQIGACATGGANYPVTRRWTGSGISQFEFQSKRPGSGVVMRTGRQLYANFSASAAVTGRLDG